MSSRLLGSLKKFYRKIFKDTPNVKTKIKIATERHGSVYGGWHIKRDSLNRDSVVYSVGIGKDISFDISVIEKYGCLIYGYDPTPGLDEWVKLNQVNSLFKFFPYGLSDKNGKLKFYKPKVKGNISHSTEIADHTDSEYFEVPCLTLEQMIFDNKHSKIDLLKMDIEGEELKFID